jgi:hypothetical protein
MCEELLGDVAWERQSPDWRSQASTDTVRGKPAPFTPMAKLVPGDDSVRGKILG